MTYKEFKRALMKITSMGDGTKSMKIERLKAMHNFVMNYFNDEGNIEPWLMVGVPDCPSEEDYEFIADNINEYKEVKDEFFKLSNRELEEYKKAR